MTVQDEAPPEARFDPRRSIIGGVVAITFLALVFTRVIPQIGDYENAAEAISAMSPASIAALVGAVLLYLFIYGWPFVAATPGLTYRPGFIVNMSAFAISNGIPGGGAVGLGVKYAQLNSYGATPTTATAAIGASGVWAMFMTLTLPLAGVCALLLAGEPLGRFGWVAAMGALAVAVIIGLFAVILRSEENAVRLGDLGDRTMAGLSRRIGALKGISVSHQVLKLRHDTVSLVNRRWPHITVANVLVSLGQFLVLAVALWAVSPAGQQVSYLVVFAAWAISQIGIMIPVTPGGLGTVDAALIGLLVSFGVDAGAATAATLVWRATLYFPQILVGVVCIFWWRIEIARRRRREAVPGGLRAA